MQKENLIKFCKNILIKLNMDSDKAHTTSEILVEADMIGHSTHGVRLLPNYISDIEKGIMNVSGNYKIISEKKIKYYNRWKITTRDLAYSRGIKNWN